MVACLGAADAALRIPGAAFAALGAAAKAPALGTTAEARAGARKGRVIPSAGPIGTAPSQSGGQLVKISANSWFLKKIARRAISEN